MTTQPTFERMQETLTSALTDLAILSGDIVGPSDVTWQDVAGTAMASLRVLASFIEDVRAGHGGPFPSFPSPAECVEKVMS